ncbi:MAG: protease modulator HflC [Candidatus Latescibacteria bacterium]|jgi:modulator of FtsH protease HflC|nr:protease modulator HflC [Candidatus Latescibacterota bacterium]
MKVRDYTIIIIVFAVIFLVGSSLYVVDETEQVVITQFGAVIEPAVTGAGLHFKLPFVQKITVLDKRLLDYDTSPRAIYTEDKKNLLVDNYAKWRIRDPITFIRSFGTEVVAQARLDDIIYAGLREELGRHTLTEVISVNREAIMNAVTEKCHNIAKEFGVDIVDVRIKRADLPEENKSAVFNRMRAERERMAMRYRSEGAEESQKIRAGADLMKRSIEAGAYRISEQIRGTGDSLAVKIYADAYRRDPQFYSFIRTLTAYKNTIDKNTVLVLPLDTEFLKYIRSPSGK